MAHIEKYHTASVKAVIDHDNRTGELPSHIDRALSCRNYDLGGHTGKELSFLQHRLDEVKASGGRYNKDRSVALVSVVISLPEEVRPEDEDFFFRQCKAHLDKHFGAENVVSAYVHLDETGVRPHLHYKAVPVVEKARRDSHGHEKTVLQLDAKSLLSRDYFTRFHKELDEALTYSLGYKSGIVQNDKTKTLQARIEDLQNENKALRRELYQLQAEARINKDFVTEVAKALRLLDIKDINEAFALAGIAKHDIEQAKKDIFNELEI